MKDYLGFILALGIWDFKKGDLSKDPDWMNSQIYYSMNVLKVW